MLKQILNKKYIYNMIVSIIFSNILLEILSNSNIYLFNSLEIFL